MPSPDGCHVDCMMRATAGVQRMRAGACTDGTFDHDYSSRLGDHTRWFRLSVETFDAIHYAGMAAWKIGALLLFAVPWIALVCVGR